MKRTKGKRKLEALKEILLYAGLIFLTLLDVTIVAAITLVFTGEILYVTFALLKRLLWVCTLFSIIAAVLIYLCLEEKRNLRGK